MGCWERFLKVALWCWVCGFLLFYRQNGFITLLLFLATIIYWIGCKRGSFFFSFSMSLLGVMGIVSILWFRLLCWFSFAGFAAMMIVRWGYILRKNKNKKSFVKRMCLCALLG